MSKLYLFLALFFALRQGYAFGQLQLDVESVATGFTRPVKVTHANDDRLFVAEIGGRIKIVKNGSVLPQPFLNIGTNINDPDWAGIYSMAFDPSFATNGFFYVMYVIKNQTAVQISRFSRSTTNPDIANPNSEQMVLTIPYTDVLGGHRGGDLVFGKDGYLYASTGDNGPGSRGITGDPENNAQNPDRLFGKLLRLNVNAPFPLDLTPGKVFAVGLRNPWRMSIDRDNGDIWLGDNGQDGWEEINYLKYPFEPSTPNFGWSCLEGNQSYTSSHCAQGTTYTPPKATYPGFSNNGGLDASVMGGYVYRGSLYPTLKGYYFFGDYASGKVGYINPAGAVTTSSGLTYASLISFGEDQSGELYLLSFSNGTLSKLTDHNPLPVKLTYFRVNQKGTIPILEWETTLEENFAHFELQYGLNGRDFETVQQIQPNESGQTYSVPDRRAETVVRYYRLKMVDLDGHYAYSQIVAVVGKASAELFASPNPTSGDVRLSAIRETDKISLYNSMGELLAKPIANSDQSISLTNYAPGVYVVIIIDAQSGVHRGIRVIRK